ncbi:hypothetical protein [Nocardia sp. NPDC057455]|uniref:LtfC-like domain-containing protein n=1 Tax=Nocardia sp. NPDC057455 TaxID=3346138 RepID=UPI00366EF98A
MTTPLFNPPPVHALPVSWHGDLVINFENVDPNSADPENPTLLDYDAGVTGYLDLRTSTPQRFPADITGSNAVVRIESEVADELNNGTLYAFILSYPGSPTTEIVVVNGKIQRFDGQAVT